MRGRLLTTRRSRPLATVRAGFSDPAAYAQQEKKALRSFLKERHFGPHRNNGSALFSRFPTCPLSCQTDAGHARALEDKMTMARELFVRGASHEALPLPPPRLGNGEDRATCAGLGTA